MKASETSMAQPWCMAGGGPQRTGRFPSRVKLAAARPQPLPARAAVQAPVVFDGENRALVADMEGTVRAYSTDGRLLWERALEGGVVAAPAVATETGHVFVGTLAGRVYAVEADSGTVAWRVDIPSPRDPRILADLLVLPGRGLVVTSSWGGRFCALSTETGETRFAWEAGVSPRAAASADLEGNLYCLRAMPEAGIQLVRLAGEGSETVLHRAEAGPPGPARALVAATPVVDPTHDRLYCIVNEDRGGHLCAWSLTGSQLLWRHPFERAIAATPAVRADGTVLVADMSGRLQGIAPDGSLAFRRETGGEYLLAPPVCDASGQAFVGDPTGTLHQIEPGGGSRILFEAPRGLQAQASFDRRGRLYLPCTDHRVYVFRNLVDA